MNKKRKIIILAIFTAMIITLLGVVRYYWYNNTYYASTDDAQVSGDFYKITPQASGKLLDFNIKEGDKVIKDQIIGRIDAEGIADSNIDSSVLRSPITGIVVKVPARVGEYEQSASSPTLAIIVNPDKLYINANIEENKAQSLRVGAQADIKIDEFNKRKFKGKVESIGQAANSAFSILPSSSSGTFTKVVQKIPVKIDIKGNTMPLLPGTNAVVKIHLK
ncbi:HlyD family efflux transporter periplasmic adaptor subunit [Clostridium sp. JN-1]|uniref:HlyD family secretion protein n=1 Tax=Clostridium sp. JN-1 TaxID=2483110 RepID=UPI000F0B1FEF|nr:HlyD family efflux transporter periplasmic adaptor subunit [Clostridium sp. JN-1]